MRQSLFVLFLLAALPAAVAASGPSLPAVVDQFHEGPGGFSANRVSAQVFTVGQSGILDRVEVPLRPSGLLREPHTRATVMVRLARTIDGVPYNRQTYTISSMEFDLPLEAAPPYESEFASLAGFQWVSLSNIGLHFSAGEQYAIEVRVKQIPMGQIPTDQTVDWCATFPNQLPYEYLGGEPWRIVDTDFSQLTSIQDFCFRTYVRPVPEPAASAVGIVGMIGIVAGLNRQRRQGSPRNCRKS